MCEISACDVTLNIGLVIEVFIKLVVFLFVLVFSISIHEAAHAWVSYKFGDNTAYLLGRVTLNPKKHADPIGTLLLPIFAFFIGLMGALAPVIGWAKPTPVNPNKWKDMTWGNFSVSLAGVLANLILVAIGIVFAKLLMNQGANPYQFLAFNKTLVNSTAELGFLNILALFSVLEFWLNFFVLFVGQVIWINLMLFLFNLLPIPPLDGGNILAEFMPKSFDPFLRFVERFGFILILFGMFMGWFKIILENAAFVLKAILTTDLL